MQWELVLEFCLPAGSPLLELYRVEQSWPTRDSGAAVASFRCVGSSSSNPSPCWLLHGTGEPRLHTRFCHRRSRRLRRGSVAARERLGNCECHDLRGARPSALECSSDSFPNRCLPNAAIAFPRVCEAHRSGSATGSLAKLVWLYSSDSSPATLGHKIIRF